jgi:NAD(P)-dependent dehydrogenase (short-subunit alcohol dehydrogenase family)
VTIEQLFRLDGRVALITGGARHLGYDMADVLAAAGARVVVTSRTLAAAEAAARRLAQRHGIEALGLALDHRDHAQVAEVVARAARWRRRLDILINNAGGGSGQSAAHLLERNPLDVVDLIQNNLVGALHCSQEAAKVMVPRRRGKIINIASIAGLIGRDRRMYQRYRMKGQPVDYAAAKAGVIGMTRDLAGLLTPHGIQVNAISPGAFARDTMPEGFRREFSDRTPAGRMGRDGIDLKGAALFLAAPASDFVTGQNLVVDGGFSLWH